MIEGRGVVESIEKARQKVEELGGIFNSTYAFKDLIFSPKTGKCNLTDDFIRVRVYSENNWNTKNVILTRKQTKFGKIGKTDNVLLKKEFDSQTPALDFIKKKFPDFHYLFEFSRKGWQYQLGKHRIFVEDIENYTPSLEIEADTEQELQTMFSRLNTKIQVKQSLPEIMKKLAEEALNTL